MAYDEQTFRRSPADDRDNGDPAAYRRNGAPASDYRGRRRDTGEMARHVDVAAEVPRRPVNEFGGQPGRDRLGIHIGWEFVLVLAVAGIGFLLYQLDAASVRPPALDNLLISATVIGLLTLGAGLTMRAGVPNLAVGPIALGAAFHFAENGDRGLLPAILPALAIAALGGLIVAVVVVVLHVPGWAATLGGAMGVIVYVQLRAAPVNVQSTYEPASQAFLLFGGFALLAVLGGALGTVSSIRRVVGSMRPVDDPALRRGPSVILPVAGSLALSSVFAVGAGVLMAAQSTGPIVPGTGLEWTGLAVGLALLAGTSAYGRRGGIFGTLLAVIAMALFLDYEQRRDFDIALFAIAGATIGAGLIITRLVETYGRRLPAAGADDWQAGTAGAADWSPDVPQTWSPSAPARERADRWDDRWGTGPQ